jgi:hypothetical protein
MLPEAKNFFARFRIVRQTCLCFTIHTHSLPVYFPDSHFVAKSMDIVSKNKNVLAPSKKVLVLNKEL